ncbi:perilipin-4 isoform X8 [Sigmodon hispidus]
MLPGPVGDSALEKGVGDRSRAKAAMGPTGPSWLLTAFLAPPLAPGSEQHIGKSLCSMVRGPNTATTEEPCKWRVGRTGTRLLVAQEGESRSAPTPRPPPLPPRSNSWNHSLLFSTVAQHNQGSKETAQGSYNGLITEAGIPVPGAGQACTLPRPYKAWEPGAEALPAVVLLRGTLHGSGVSSFVTQQLLPPAPQAAIMSASGDGTRGPLKSKGKTLSSFFGSLPGFSSARNLVSQTHSSTKDTGPATDPTGTPVPPSQVATDLQQMAKGAAGLLQPSQQTPTAGNKDVGSFSVTSDKDAFSSGVSGIMDTTKGMVQGGLGITQSALESTKEAVSGGVMGAVDMVKGLVQGGLDTSKTVFSNTRDTVTTGLTGAVNMAKVAAQGGLDTSKSVVMGTKDTVTTGLTGAMNVAKGTVQTGLDTSKSVLMGTKDTVTTGLTGAMNVAQVAAQGGLDTSKSVVMGTKDTVTTGLTGAMNVAKGTVQTGLDTSKSVLMGTKDTVTTGLTGAMNVAKGTVQTGLDTSKSVVMGTKDTVTTGLTGAMNVAKGTVQTGMDTSKSVLMGTKDTVTTGLTGAMNVAKGTVQTGLDTSKSVLMGTKDTVTTGLTGAMNVAQVAAQGGLDTSKSVVMGTKDTVTTGLTGAMNVAKGTVQTGLDTSKSVVMGTKDTVCAGITGVMNMAKGIIQKGLDTTRDTQSAMLCSADNMAINTTHTGVHTGPSSLSDSHATMCSEPSSYRATEQGVGHAPLTSAESLCSDISSVADTCGLGLVIEPIAATKGLVSGVASAHPAIQSEEECGQLAITSFAALHDELEGLGDIFQPMTAEEQAQLAASEAGPRVLSADRESYFVRLGDLAPNFRQRAFEHALSHIQHNQFQARAVLAQLQEAFQVILMAMEAPGGQLCWDQSLSSMVPASVAQDRLCILAQQLHAAYSGLAANLQGLPEVQQQAGLVRHSLCKLYGLVSSVSGSELQAEQLTQSSASMVQAWQGLEVLLDKLQQRPPLGWLVGPFALTPGGQL